MSLKSEVVSWRYVKKCRQKMPEAVAIYSGGNEDVKINGEMDLRGDCRGFENLRNGGIGLVQVSLPVTAK